MAGWAGSAAIAVLALPASPAAAVNSAPSSPVLVSPVVGGGLNGGPGQLFTVRSTDPEGDPYFATVMVSGGTLTNSFVTSVSPSGMHSTGSPPLPIGPGTYTWTAMATDIPTDRSTTPLNSSWSTPQSFTVSSPPTAGAGQVSGEVTFAGTGLPGSLKPCATTSFTLTSDLVDPTLPDVNSGVVINIQGHEYAGPMKLSGTGTGACANASAGSGTISVTATDVEPSPGSISCSVSGYFTRLLADVTLSLGGTCTINGITTAPVNFRAQTEFRPDRGAGDGTVLGVDQSVTHALFAGYFSVVPS